MITKRTFDVEYKEADDTMRTVSGHASVFNMPSRSGGWFEEVIEAGAFDNAIKNSDVRALVNHDPNILLARTKSGTLKLSIDEKGLRYDFEMPNNREDIRESMIRGDMDQSSFAFTIKADEWEERDGDIPLRRIKEVDRLYDVSLVTYPFYEEAEASLRSAYEKQTNKPMDIAAMEARKRTLYFLNLNK